MRPDFIQNIQVLWMMDAIYSSEQLPVRSVTIAVRFGLSLWLGPRHHLETSGTYFRMPCYADSAP